MAHPSVVEALADPWGEADTGEFATNLSDAANHMWAQDSQRYGQ